MAQRRATAMHGCIARDDYARLGRACEYGASAYDNCAWLKGDDQAWLMARDKAKLVASCDGLEPRAYCMSQGCETAGHTPRRVTTAVHG